MIDHIITFLRKNLANKPAILGLSGGVDSAVVAYLLAKAIGSDKIHALIMPSDTTSEQDIVDADLVAKILNIHSEKINITPLLDQYLALSNDFNQALARANLQARIRMSLLYGKANAIGGLVVGTGNKSELLTGYFTKYGDGGVDLLPIAHLYKTQVWRLAEQLGVPASIIQKPPTAGLRRGQSDEEDLQMSYTELDTILQAIEKQQSLDQFNRANVQRVQQLYQQTRHKLELPPRL